MNFRTCSSRVAVKNEGSREKATSRGPDARSMARQEENKTSVDIYELRSLQRCLARPPTLSPRARASLANPPNSHMY